MVTFVVLVLLGVIWALVFAHWVKTRKVNTGISIGNYSRRLSVLDRSERGAVVPLRSASARGAAGLAGSLTGSSGSPSPRLTAVAGGLSSSAARRRRRKVLIGLGGAAFVTLFAALTAGGMWVMLHLLIDALLLGFVLLVVQYHRAIEEHQIRSRPAHRPAPRRSPAAGADRELLRQAR